jgi:hypothetical protein
MNDERRHDSSRDLLEEIEDGWATPAAPHVRTNVPRATGANPLRPGAPKFGRGTLLGGLTGSASESTSPSPPSEPFARARSAPPVAAPESDPDLAALDEQWPDDLDDDDDDVDEPELPDERLDPEAFARAKKERDERAAKRRDKKRSKAEAKRARAKARADAARQKQKAKKNRPGAPPKPKAPADDESDPRELAATSSASDRPARARSVPPKPERSARRGPSTMASIRLLAIVLGVLLALAALVSILTR